MGNLIQGTKIGYAKSRASPRNVFYDSARGYVMLLGGLHHLFRGLSCKVIVHSGLLASLAFVLYTTTFLPTLSILFFNQVHYRVICVLIVCCSNGVVAMNNLSALYSATALYGQSKRLDRRSSQRGLPKKTTNNWPMSNNPQ